MPNWCSTTYSIYSNKAEEIYNALEKATSTYYDPEIWNGSKSWYGYLATYSGRFYDVYSCRGYITGLELSDTMVRVDMETAWQPMPRLLIDFVEDYDEEASITYIAEECGAEIYCTNDDDVVGEVYVDAEWDELPHEWEDKLSDCNECYRADVQNILEELLGKKGTWDELVSEAEDKYPDAYLRFHTYEYEPIDSWGD